MAKADLIERVNALAEQLGQEVATDDLTNSQLQEVIDNLQAAVDAGSDTPAVTTVSAKDDPAAARKVAAAKKELPPFYVAEGKSMTTLARGVIGPLGEIFADDFADGKTALNVWVKSEHVCKG